MFPSWLRFGGCVIIFLGAVFCLTDPGWPGQVGGETIAPEREISVVQEAPQVPEWKRLWDTARDLVRQDMHQEALQLYRKLYELKPNIEEAVWEYCKVLLKLDQYNNVSQLVDSLLEKDPVRQEYLVARGQIAMANSDFKAAVHYFSTAFEQNPVTEPALVAQKGLVASLRRLGQKRLALPLLEQLRLRQPGDLSILHQLARDAWELGRKRQARSLYHRLLERSDIDDRVIFQAIEVFDSPEDDDLANRLRLRYLDKNPGYLPFRVRIADYFKKRQDYDKAFEQLLVLAESASDGDTYLLDAAEIAWQYKKRPDRALLLYRRYQESHPDDQAVSEKISRIVARMAEDFLVIVENGGADQLWLDLQELAPNRRDIFLHMADLLDNREKKSELTEVLNILHDDRPDDLQLTYRWLKSLADDDRFVTVNQYLQSTSTPKDSRPFVLLRIEIAKKLADDIGLLGAYEDLLQLDEKDTATRRRCIELAGSLGKVDLLRGYYGDPVSRDSNLGERSLLTLSYMQALIYNYQFTAFTETAKTARAKFTETESVLQEIDFLQVESLRRQGRFKEMKTYLRQLLSRDGYEKKVLFLLAEQAVAENDVERARSWLKPLRKTAAQKRTAKPDTVTGDDLRLLLLEGKKDIIAQEYTRALGRLEMFFRQRPTTVQEAEIQHLLDQLRIQQCWLHFYQGDIARAISCRGALATTARKSTEGYLLDLVLNRERLNPNKRNSMPADHQHGDGMNWTTLLSCGKMAMDRGYFTIARYCLVKGLAALPDSVVANTTFTALLEKEGRREESERILALLAKRFPKESYFQKRRVDNAIGGGDYSAGLRLLVDYYGISDLVVFWRELKNQGDYQTLVVLARLLWGERRQEESLQVYRTILDPPVMKVMSRAFDQEKINYFYLNREQSFWSSLILLVQSEPTLLAELMEPEFLLDNLGTPAGRIVADNYALYRWQMLIEEEYLARKAIFNRNYYYAEQSYNTLDEEGRNTEIMLDLATVYGRIGKYRKEAQVYEQIQSSGIHSPAVMDSVERTSQQTMPQNTIESGYEKTEGRDGLVDMVVTTIGSSFWMTPGLDKDIRLTYGFNRYESNDGQESVEGNMFLGEAVFDVGSYNELFLSGGVSKLNSDNENRFLYEVGFRGRLDKNVEGFLSWKKDFVYDSIAVLDEKISFQQFAAGLNIETSLGVGYGGDFGHRNYSDGNDQNRLHLFADYTLFRPTVEMSLRYDFNYLHNDSTDESESPGEPDETILSYWRPKSFSDNELSVAVKHNFLGYETGGQQKMSYYSLKNTIGLEEDSFTFGALFDIFLEMSPHFLLKGSFSFSTSNDYNDRVGSVSLHYRW